MEMEMELETGNWKWKLEMIVKTWKWSSDNLQSELQSELTWKLCLLFDSLVLKLPYLFNGYCAGSWNNDDSDLTSSQEAPTHKCTES